MKNKIAIALVLTVCVTMPAISADIYRWTDPSTGKVVTTPSLPPYPIKEKRPAGGLPGGELINVIIDTDSPQVKEIIEKRKLREADEKRISEKAISPSSPNYDQSDPGSNNLPSLEFKIIPIKLSKDEIDNKVNEAKDYIINSLKDPGSANFREVKIFQVEHIGGIDIFVCGEVNAKNSYGGYVGFKNFVVWKNRLNKTSGGIGDSGSIFSTKVNEKWWKYEADDLCIIKGIPVQ